MRPRLIVRIGFLVLSVVGFYRQPAARISVKPPVATQTLRVMTYNIHVGIGMDKKLDLEPLR